LNRLTAVTDPLVQTTSYTYSLANQLTQIRYADSNTIMGRLIKSIDPSEQAETYVYDANSNLIQHVDRKGQTQTNGYNKMEPKVIFQVGQFGRRFSVN